MEMFAIYLPKQMKTLKWTCIRQHQEAKCSLHPLLRKVPTHCQQVTLGIFRALYFGELWRKCRSKRDRRKDAEMYTAQHFPLCQEVTATSAQLMGTLHDSGVFWKTISGAHVGKKQGTNEIWQSKVSRFWITSEFCIHQSHCSDFLCVWKLGLLCLGPRISDLSGEWRCLYLHFLRISHSEVQPTENHL